MAARSLNKVTLMGNLTRDPELRYTPKGTAVCTFGLATNRSWTPADGGERQEEVEFHRVVSWSKLAEICSQLLFKGRRVYLEGRLQTRKWEGQDGQERTTTEVVIDNMIALGAPKGGESRGAGFQAGTNDGAGRVGVGAGDAGGSASGTDEATGDVVVDEPEVVDEGSDDPAKKLVGKKGKASGDDNGSDKESDDDVADDIPF